MPNYEYQCKSCAHRFEIWQKMIDEPLTVCPQCQGTIRRVLYPAGIVFKGSGFYKTDHGSAPVSDKNQTTSGENKESTPKQEETAGEKKAEKTSSPSVSEKTAVAAD